MSIPSLEEVMAAGQQRGWAPEARASGIRLWQEDMIKLGRERYAEKDPDTYWKVVRGVGDDVNAALAGLSAQAGEREAAKLFPDPAERAQFRSVVDSSGGDPDRMDAPPAWQEAARRAADAGAAPAFQPGGVQLGSIGQGSTALAVYEIRPTPDGGGYEAYVQPKGEEGKAGKPLIVPISGNGDAIRTRLAGELGSLQTELADAGFAGGGRIDYSTAFLPAEGQAAAQEARLRQRADLERRVASKKARLELAERNDLSSLLHLELDDQLRNNKVFLEQVPRNLLEQFTTRPVASVVRSLAQATAAATDGRIAGESLTAAGQEAVDLQTPGDVRSRFAAGDDNSISDMVSQGIESVITLLGPALLAKGGGALVARSGQAARGVMAAEAMRGADVAGKAPWAAMFSTSYGANYASAMQAADALQSTDPQRAARIRSLSQWTSLMNAGIEVATERIFPDEARLLKGQRMPWGEIATMPLKEMAEEYVGAVGQNAINAAAGMDLQDPLKAAEGGFWGSLPFMGGHAMLRVRRPGAAAAPVPAAGGPDSSLFPGGGAAPAFEAAPEGLDPAAPALEQPPAFDPLPPESGAESDGGPLVGAPPPAAAVATRAELAAADGAAQTPPLTPATEQDPTGTVPETPETLTEQRRRVVSGQRPAMLFPGVPPDQVPREFQPGQDEGLILTATSAGTFLHPFDISSAEIEQAVADGRTGQLLGMGTDAKPQDATDALVQRTADGTEVAAAAVTPETFDDTLAALSSSASPGDTVSLETPEEVIARRVDPAAAPSVSGFPASSEVEKVDMPPPAATPESVEGESINRNWTTFAPESGTLGIPRAEMPQIKAEHRGALVNFLNARGVAHERQEVRPDSLKPTQAEFSPGKVDKARGFEGAPRAILVSSDNHVVDGHHQWVAALDNPEQTIPVMRLDAPIRDLIPLVNEFPSSEQSGGGTPKAAAAPRAQLPKGVKRSGSLPERLLPEYFAPGNIVPGYGGMDKVLEFVPQGGSEPVWRVRVQRQIREADGTFRDDPAVPERWHSTHPTNGDAADAGFSLDPQKSAAENWADQTIAEGRGRLYTGIDPALLAAYAVKGSYLIARGVRDFAAWSAEMLREFGEAVRPYLQRAWAQSTGAEETALTDSPVPAVPQGPINIFGQRVQADERLRESWRKNFTPKAYAPFSEEQLNRDIASWIGKEGGLEGAYRLLMDETSGLKQYERNALAQQLAVGLDMRARRSERAGNAQATAAAEAMMDQVIGKLEGWATDAGQALRSFAMWMRFSPRGIIRHVQRQTARERTEHVQEKLDTTPDAVINAVNEEEARAGEEQREERKSRADIIAQRWIDRLARSQSDTLHWGSTAAPSELEKLIRDHMETVNRNFTPQAEALGVPAHEADVLNSLVLEEHRRSATIAQEKALERLVERLTKPKATREVKAKIPPLIQALLDAKAAGVLNRAAFLDAWSAAFGLPRFTPQFAAEIRALAERAERAPKGSWLRQMAQQALMSRLAMWEGIPPTKVLLAFWYSNILSGIGTHVLNIYSNAQHLLLKTIQVIGTNRPKHSLRFIQGMISGAAEGAKQGWSAFWHGVPVVKGATEWQQQDILEMMWSNDHQKLWEKIAKYGAASWGKYVFRGLTAEDSFFFQTLKEGRAYLQMARAMEKDANFKLSAGLDAASWADAQEQAALDLKDAGVSAPTTRQIDRRAWEIRESRRPVEVIQESREFAAQATFNHEPTGSMGVVAGMLRHFVNGIPPARGLVPFINIPANIVTQGLDFTPVGLLRALTGRHTSDFVKDVMNLANGKGWAKATWNRQQRYEKLFSGALGPAAGFMLYALALGKDPEGDDDDSVDFMIYATGPSDANKRAQMPKGWKQFTIKIGRNYYSYAESPLSLLLSAVGGALDAERYASKEQKKLRAAMGGYDRNMERLGDMMTAAGQGFLRTGTMSSLNKLMGGDETQGMSWLEKLKGVGIRTAAGFTPAQGLMRSVAVAMDPNKVDTSTFRGAMMASLPMLRSQGQPMLDAFGENIREPGDWWVRLVGGNRFVGTQDRSDAEWTWLKENNLTITGLERELTLTDYTFEGKQARTEAMKALYQEGIKGLAADRLWRAIEMERTQGLRLLTPKEATEFQRLAGPLVRKAVVQTRNLQKTGKLREATADQLQRALSERVSAARKVARMQMIK